MESLINIALSKLEQNFHDGKISLDELIKKLSPDLWELFEQRLRRKIISFSKKNHIIIYGKNTTAYRMLKNFQGDLTIVSIRKDADILEFYRKNIDKTIDENSIEFITLKDFKCTLLIYGFTTICGAYNWLGINGTVAKITQISNLIFMEYKTSIDS